MRGCTDRGPLVQTGEGISHKLSGAISGNTSRQDIPERAGKQTCIVFNRQSNSSRVHKQSGQDSLCPGDHPGKAGLDVVSRERDPDLSSIPPRRGEHQSRHRVMGDEGLLQLEAESQRILVHFQDCDIDLFASCLSFQLPQYFNWKPDPLAKATDAFLQDWRGQKVYVNSRGTS